MKCKITIKNSLLQATLGGTTFDSVDALKRALEKSLIDERKAIPVQITYEKDGRTSKKLKMLQLKRVTIATGNATTIEIRVPNLDKGTEINKLKGADKLSAGEFHVTIPDAVTDDRSSVPDMDTIMTIWLGNYLVPSTKEEFQVAMKSLKNIIKDFNNPGRDWLKESPKFVKSIIGDNGIYDLYKSHVGKDDEIETLISDILSKLGEYEPVGGKYEGYNTGEDKALIAEKKRLEFEKIQEGKEPIHAGQIFKSYNVITNQDSDHNTREIGLQILIKGVTDGVAKGQEFRIKLQPGSKSLSQPINFMKNEALTLEQVENDKALVGVVQMKIGEEWKDVFVKGKVNSESLLKEVELTTNESEAYSFKYQVGTENLSSPGLYFTYNGKDKETVRAKVNTEEVSYHITGSGDSGIYVNMKDRGISLSKIYVETDPLSPLKGIPFLGSDYVQLDTLNPSDELYEEVKSLLEGDYTEVEATKVVDYLNEIIGVGQFSYQGKQLEAESDLTKNIAITSRAIMFNPVKKGDTWKVTSTVARKKEGKSFVTIPEKDRKQEIGFTTRVQMGILAARINVPADEGAVSMYSDRLYYKDGLKSKTWTKEDQHDFIASKIKTRRSNVNGKAVLAEKYLLTAKAPALVAKKEEPKVEVQTPVVSKPKKTLLATKEASTFDDLGFQLKSSAQVASEQTIRDIAERMSSRIGIPFKFISDRSQEWSGKFENGIAYINLAYASADTAIHEIVGHPIVRAIKTGKGFKQFPVSSSQLQELYPNIYSYDGSSMEEFEETFRRDEEIAKKQYLKDNPEIAKEFDQVDNSKSNLYKNLLKELESGRGKEVLDEIKKNYDVKSYSNYIDVQYAIDEEDFNSLKEQGYDFYQISSEDGAFIFKKQVEEIINYTLEEQQEEALVELLGLMTAEKLDAVKDGKLISLLKRLLKEIKSFIKDLLKQREVNVDSLPDNLTLGDLSDLLAYSNSKLILPGYAVKYTTPDNQQFTTYEEASKHISKLVNSIGEVELDNINIPVFEEYKTKYGIYKNLFDGILIDNLTKEEAQNKLINIREEYPKAYIDFGQSYKDYTKKTILIDFIDKNKQYEQSKEIIEEWKKVNGIVYNPEEVYSRGQGFYSVVGAYSNFDVNLMFQNLLAHIEDNEKAGGKFAISAFTRPVDKKLGHLEGGGGKIRFKMFPKSEDILWSSNKDAYSGSVWDASEKINKDKKSELLGVSYTKYPALQNIDSVQPNLADIIEKIDHGHNELGIVLSGNNFRIEYDADVPVETKKILNAINAILDSKYGKLVEPAKSGSIVQPTQIEDTLVQSIDDVKIRILNGEQTDPSDLDDIREDFEDGKITQEQYDILTGKNKKEYNSQALVNTKIAALKEVAKKYPRSLIVSQVIPTKNTVTAAGFDPDELPFQKLKSKTPNFKVPISHLDMVASQILWDAGEFTRFVAGKLDTNAFVKVVLESEGVNPEFKNHFEYVKNEWFKGSNLFKLSEAKDDDSDPDNLETKVGDDVKTGFEERTVQDKSSLELAGKFARVFFRTIPAIETKNGKVVYGEDYYQYKRDKDGNIIPADYTALWNTVSDMVVGALTINEIISKLENGFKKLPEVYIVIDRLKELIPKNEDGSEGTPKIDNLMVLKSIEKSFAKMLVPTLLVLGNNKDGEFSYNVVSSGRLDGLNIANAVNTWFRKYANDNGLVEGGVLDHEAFYDLLLKRVGNLEWSNIESFWSEIGLVFPDMDERQERKVQSVVTSFTKAMLDKFKSLNGNEIKLTPDLFDIVKTTHQIRKWTSWGNRPAALRFQDTLAEVLPYATSNMTKNAEGENQSNLHNFSSWLLYIKYMNEGLHSKVARLKNPIAKFSLGLKASKAGKQILPVNISGTINNKKDDSNGTNSIGLNTLDYIRQEFHTLFLEGVKENIRAETASSSFGFKIEYENGKYLPIGMENVRERMVDTYWGYFQGEIERIFLERKQPTEYGARFYNAYKGGFTFFYDVISQEGQDKLIELIDKMENVSEINTLFTPAYKASLGKYLNTYFDEEVMEFKQWLLEEGGVQVDDQHPIFKTTQMKELIKSYGVDKLIDTFMVNGITMAWEEVIMFHGEIGHFDKFYKRSKSSISNGTPMVISDMTQRFLDETKDKASFSALDGFTPNYLVDATKMTSMILAEDKMVMDPSQEENWRPILEASIKATGDFFGKTSNVQKQVDKIISGYKDKAADVSDGDAKIHPDAYRLISIGVDSWSYEKEMGFRYLVFKEKIARGFILSKEEQAFFDMVTKKIEKEGYFFQFPKLKFQYRGNASKNKTNVAVELLDKFALQGLWPDLIKGKPKAEALYKQMTKEGVAYVKFQSGTKIGTYGADSLVDLIENVKKGDYKLESLHEIESVYLKEQVKTPDKIKDKGIFGSQPRKLMISNLSFNGIVIPEVQEAKELWQTSQADLAEYEKRKLITDLGGDPDSDRPNIDLEVLVDMIREELSTRDVPESYSYLFEDFQESDLMEMSLSPQIVQTIIYSLLKNRIVKVKYPGGQFVQVSSALMDTGNERDLKNYREENGVILPADCKITLSGDFLNLLNLKEVKEKGGTRDALNELLLDQEFRNKYKRELTIFAYRIPNQGYNSNDILMVQEFLPEYMGNTIVTNPQIVVKSGTDYDYDKMNVVSPSLGKNGRYISTPSKDSADYDKLYKKAKYNETIEASQGILLNPINFHRLITPNSTDEIVEALDKVLIELYDLKPVNGKYPKVNPDPILTRVMSMVQSYKKWDAVKSKDLLGIGSVANTFYTLMQDANFQFKEEEGVSQMIINKVPFFFKVPLLSKEAQEQVNISDAFVISQEVIDKLEYINQFINLTVDAASNDIAGYTNMKVDNTGFILFQVMLGVPFEQILRFIHQPIIYKYHQIINVELAGGVSKADAQKTAYEKLLGIELTTVNKGGYIQQKSSEKIWQEIRNIGYPDEIQLKKLVPKSKISEVTEFTKEDKEYLVYYIVGLEQASALREVQAFNSFDTGTAPNYKLSQHNENPKKIEKRGLFSMRSVFDIHDKSVISHLNVHKEFGILTNAAFPIKDLHTWVERVAALSQEVYSDPEKFIRVLDNDFLLYIVQNFGNYDSKRPYYIAQLENGTLMNRWANLVTENPELKDTNLFKKLVEDPSKTSNLVNPMFFMGMDNSSDDFNLIINELRDMLKNPKTEAWTKDFLEIGFFQSGYNQSKHYMLKGFPPEFIQAMVGPAFHKFNDLSRNQKSEECKQFFNKFLENRVLEFGKFFRSYYGDFDAMDMAKERFNMDTYRMMNYLTPRVADFVQEPVNEVIPVKGINIKSDKTTPNSLANRLTNPNWYAKGLYDVETEYKANQSKKKAPKLNMDDALKYDMNLMYSLQVKKFKQNPELIDEINEQGGLEFIKNSSHIVGVKGSRWEGVGMESNFIKVLAKSYETVSKELGKFKDSQEFTDFEEVPNQTDMVTTNIEEDSLTQQQYKDMLLRPFKGFENGLWYYFAEKAKEYAPEKYDSIVNAKDYHTAYLIGADRSKAFKSGKSSTPGIQDPEETILRMVINEIREVRQKENAKSYKEGFEREYFTYPKEYLSNLPKLQFTKAFGAYSNHSFKVGDDLLRNSIDLRDVFSQGKSDMYILEINNLTAGSKYHTETITTGKYLVDVKNKVLFSINDNDLYIKREAVYALTSALQLSQWKHEEKIYTSFQAINNYKFPDKVQNSDSDDFLAVSENIQNKIDSAQDDYLYYGTWYKINTQDGKGVDVVNYRGKTVAKNKLLDAYNSNPNVDVQSGKAFRTTQVVTPNDSRVLLFSKDGKDFYLNEDQEKAYYGIKSFLKSRLKSKDKPEAGLAEFNSPLAKEYSGIIPKAMWNNMIGLVGKGGVGKTSTVGKIIQDTISELSREKIWISDESILYAAPTHNAVTMLQEALELNSEGTDGVKTLDSMVMKNQKPGSENAKQGKPGDVVWLLNDEKYVEMLEKGFAQPIIYKKIVVIDESSMVGREFFRNMLDRIKLEQEFYGTDTLPLFIFMGDYRQLPPVESDKKRGSFSEGIISATLFSDTTKFYELSQVMRSKSLFFHGIFNSIGDQISQQRIDHNEGKSIKPFDSSEYDKLTSESTNDLLVVNESDVDYVVNDYVNILTEQNNPYEIFWVHYNAVANPVTIAMAEKIRKAYFQKLGTPYTPNITVGDYIEYKGNFSMFTEIDNDLKIGRGTIKPRARVKVLEVYPENTVLGPELSKHFGELTVNTMVYKIFNRQGKERIIRIYEKGTFEIGAYANKFQTLSIKDSSGKVHKKEVSYRAYKESLQNIFANNSRSLDELFVPSYIGSSHTVQGAGYSKVIVGDYNIRMNDPKIDLRDMESSWYVSLTRAVAKLAIIKPNGIPVKNNRFIFSWNDVKVSDPISPITEEKETDQCSFGASDNHEIPF